MSIFSRLLGRIGLSELIFIILLGLTGSVVWYALNLPPFVIRGIEITHENDQVQVTITSTYRGGCEAIRLSQWAVFEETGEIRQLSDYRGPPRARIGGDPVEHIIRLGRALKPGEWTWHAEAICTRFSGAQEHFTAPPTPFFVEGPT